MKWIFELNPGYNAFMQLGFGNAVQMPFSVARWRLTNVLMMSKCYQRILTRSMP